MMIFRKVCVDKYPIRNHNLSFVLIRDLLFGKRTSHKGLTQSTGVVEYTNCISAEW